MKMKRAAIHRKSGFRDPVFLFAVLAIYFGILPTRAYAYLDPGTGSFIFQILVGAVVGGIFYFKNFIASLKEKIARLFGRKPADDSASQSAHSADSAGCSSNTAADDKTAANNQATGSNKPADRQGKQP